MKLCILFIGILLSVFANAAERLVTAGGSLTEIVYALDSQERLVAVDSSSHFPVEARKLPQIGYYRALNVEGVLSVKPDTLLLLNGAGPQNVVAQLKGLGLNITMVDNPKTVRGLIDTINQVAEVIDRKEAGKLLAKNVRGKIDSILASSKLNGKTAVFLMSAGERGLVAAGQNTTPQLIFDELQIDNPFDEVKSFKPVSAEAIASAMPDIILLASHTSRGTTVEALCEDPQLVLWSTKMGCRLHKIDSLKFIGLTPRLPEAMQETHDLLMQYADGE